MFPGVMEIALERMFHTCCRDFFIATRFPFYVKAGFFLVVFRWFYKVFGSPKASKLDLNLELFWRSSSWEASWDDVVAMLGGFWGPRWHQDGSKLAPRRFKMASEVMLTTLCKSMCQDLQKILQMNGKVCTWHI